MVTLPQLDNGVLRCHLWRSATIHLEDVRYLLVISTIFIRLVPSKMTKDHTVAQNQMTGRQGQNGKMAKRNDTTKEDGHKWQAKRFKKKAEGSGLGLHMLPQVCISSPA